MIDDDDPRRVRRRWMWVTVSAVVVPVAVFAAGADLAHALLAGLAGAVVVVVLRSMPLGEHVMFPRLPFAAHEGARRDVSSLSWTLYGRGGMTVSGQRRLRRVALDALDHAGIDVTTAPGRAEAERLLGRGLLTFLLDPDPSRPPDARTVERCVAALETLDLRKGHP